MFKKYIVISALLQICIVENSIASTKNDVRGKKHSREICGFRFANIAGMKMTTRPISTDSLRNRIDNERFNACPYKVIVRYMGISFDLDFGSDVTLDSVRKREGYRKVNTGVFEYGEDGWVTPSDNRTIRKSDITVRNFRNGVVVSGIFLRKNNSELTPDYCFGISAIGRSGYLTDLECQPTKQALQPINDLFKRSVVISFPNEAHQRSKNAKSDFCGDTSDCVY